MQNESPEIELLRFKAKVKEMLDAQQAYFKSGKDRVLLEKSKKIEREVKEWLTMELPKKQLELSM